MILRPYQQAAVDAVYEYLRTHDDNPCIVIPTAGGKTPLLSTICRDAVQLWDGRVLILAHVKELLAQAVDKLKAVAPDLAVGVYSAGLKRRDTNRPVTVAGIQSVYKRACELDAFDLAIVDECHLIPEEGDGMYRQFLADAKKVNPNLRVIGLTATPYRMKSGLICGPDNILNAICYEVGVRELIRDGYLCPLVTKHGRQKADTNSVHVRGGEFVPGELEDLMDQDTLVEAACEEIVERTRNRNACLIFAAGVRHGQHVVRVLAERHGIECGFVCGDTSDGQRADVLARFRGIPIDGLFERPPVKYLCNVNVLTTGFDAPNVDCVVLLRPTMSPGLFYQMCLDMSTEVMTPSGWARCDEVRVGDDVGGYDLATGHIEWCKAEDKVRRRLAPGERMYAISAPHLDVRVTHLHQMIYRCNSESCKHWRQRTAESLACIRDSYSIPVAGKGDGPGVSLSDDELRFLGWTLTDGYRNPHNNAVIICQSACSPSLDAIRVTLDGCGFGYRVYRQQRFGRQAKYPDAMQFVVPYGKPRGINRGRDGWARLADYLNRPIMESLADASRAQLRVMLEAMNLGDGAKRTTTSWKSRTMTLCLGEHKYLADQLQALLVRRGFRCNLNAASQRTSWHKGEPKTQYRLHVREQTEATIGGAVQRPTRLVKRRSRLEETPSHADEQVWCLRTRLGTLVTRRNGKVAVVGNCGRGFRLHPGKTDCLVLDFGGNVNRHGPIDQIEVRSRDAGNGTAPVKECPQCQSIIAAGYANCPDCGHAFPPPEKPKHEAEASNAGILSGQVTTTVYNVSEVFYGVHVKRGATDEDPRTMRVDYRVGWHDYKSEWVCFEHTGYARQKAIAWWKQRSPDPVPDDVERAVEIANGGGLADTKKITVRTVAGERYERIVGYELGAMPEPLPAEVLEFYEDEVPF